MKLYGKAKISDFKYAKGNVDVFGNTFHSCYEIYFLINGDVEYISSHTRQKLEPFQVIVIPPGEYHQFAVCGNPENYERCVINIQTDNTYSDISDKLTRKILTLSEEHRIIQNFFHLKESITQMASEDFAFILDAVATDTLIMLKYCTDSEKQHTESLGTLASEAMNYIDEHYTETLSLELLAEKMYCSVSLLCHEFSRNFGISIKKYILQKRMNKARMDLKNGEKPEIVSLKYGFANYSSFYRIYKKYFGTAPSKTEHNK